MKTTALLLTACVLGIGCSSGPDLSEKTWGELALQISAGVNVASASYVVTGPGSFARSGTVEVKNSPEISVAFNDLPIANGYAINVSASTKDGAACSGSATFNVTANGASQVFVRLFCGPFGTANVTSTVNVCPILEGVGASPAEALVGHTIALSASARDPDTALNLLRMRWTAPVGQLDSAGTPTPTFRCTAPGEVPVTVRLSDGDPDPSCMDQRTLSLKCTAP